MAAGILRKRIWVSSAALMMAVLTSVPAVAETGYTILFSGRDAGTLVVDDKNGERHVTYQFNDRGRGPELKSRVRLGAELLPQSVTLDGVSYFKNPVKEQFTMEGGMGRWESDPGNGSASAPGFYLPSQWVPEYLAMLARAALAAGGEVALLPSGRARIEKVLDHQPEAVASAPRASLYFIHGLDFAPEPIWLDEKNELLLQGGTWNNAVRTDLKAVSPELIKIQEGEATKRLIAQARTLGRKPTGPVLFRNAGLFDSESKRLRPGMDVLVTGNRITSVRPTRAGATPAGVEVIDASGKTLLPGLWDMHVHIGSDDSGLLHLGAGVTTVRDMAMDPDELIERGRRFDSGELIGPRILMAGFIDGPGPFAGPSKALVDTPEGIRQWVNLYADKGYKQIKLYSSLKPELVPVAVQTARARGLRVSGHIPAGMTMEEAVRAGFDEVQHANFWFLNFLGPEVNAKTMTMTRFHAVGRHGHEIATGSADVARMVKLLREKGTVLDPTLVVFERQMRAKNGEPSPDIAAIVDRLPAVRARSSRTGQGLTANEKDRALYSSSFDRMLQMTKRLYDAGITIVPGTDALPGFTYHRELELYTEAGIPAAEVLHMATLGAAKVMKQDRDLGSIAPGKLADLILVEGDPTRRMSDIRKTELVMKNGSLFDPDALYGALGVAPRK